MKPLHMYFDKNSKPYLLTLMSNENLPPEIYRCFQYATDMFQKNSYFTRMTKRGLKMLAPGIKEISKVERMPFHYKTIECRLNSTKSSPSR